MIEEILNLKLPTLVSRWPEVFTRLASCTLPNSSLELRHVKHVVHSPVGWKLQSKGHRSHTLEYLEWSHKLVSQLPTQARRQSQMLGAQPG